MAKKPTILVIDDHANMRTMLTDLLSEDYEVVAANNGKVGLAEFKRIDPDLVLSDIRMPDAGGMDVLRAVKDEDPDTEVILMTAYAEVEQGVEAIRVGAYDYVVKPFDPEEMLLTIGKALERRSLRRRTEELQQEVEGKFGFDNVVGESEAIRQAFALARKASASDATVLLTGESGTGKEVFARAVHYAGHRAKKAFVAINCAAMPRDLIESELFGHLRGAFSGATHDKPGVFEQADGGTLLLDEITELAPELQAKINRALQEKEVRRLGDTRDRSVDVRVIASTNRDLQVAMATGEFREDLYFRLNVFPIHLPPLRERDGDIRLLVAHFLAMFAPEGVEFTIEQDALLALFGHDWPGNVRELRNAIERAVVLAEGGRITADLFTFGPSRGRPGPVVSGMAVAADMPYRDAMDKMTRQCQTEYLVAVLQMCEGNVTRAAEHAGIERESFHRLMRKCGVRTEDIKRDLDG